MSSEKATFYIDERVAKIEKELSKMNPKARAEFKQRVEEENISIDEQMVIIWITFYRRNPHIFVEHYLGLKLHLFQAVMIYFMFMFPSVALICSRNISKSFITTVYAISKAILYPSSQVLVTSYTKKQAGLIITEKLQKELMNWCPVLQDEIGERNIKANDLKALFVNGSSLFATVCGEGARGYRSTVTVLDEQRLCDQEALSTIIQPTMQVRPVPYLKKERYSNIEYLVETPTIIYLTSCHYTSNWYYETTKRAISRMYKGEAFCLCTDYALTLKHNIKTKKQLIQAKADAVGDAWQLEYQNIPIGGSGNAFYPYNLLSARQTKKNIMLLPTIEDIVNKRKDYFGYIKKEQEEIRILSIDIAMASSINGRKNDRTTFTVYRCVPSNGYYRRDIAYFEAMEGKDIDEQTLRARRVHDYMDIDTIVIDGRSFGHNFCGSIAKTVYDDEYGVERPAIRCFNNDVLKETCKNFNALPKIYAFVGTDMLNHDGHTFFKGDLTKGAINLPVTHLKGIDELKTQQTYNYASVDEQARMEAPFLLSDEAVYETFNLITDEDVLTKRHLYKLKEPSGMTKDLYSSMMMGNYYIHTELDVTFTEDDDDEYDEGYDSVIDVSQFIYSR